MTRHAPLRLVSTPPTYVALDTIHVEFSPRTAANDGGLDERMDRCAANVNDLVTRVAGSLAAFARPEGVTVEMDLASWVPPVSGSPARLAFALSGIMAGMLRNLDQATDGVVRVETRADTRSVRIAIVCDGVPPIDMVRAISDADTDAGDRTMRHCRELIESQDGRIELTSRGDFLGFSIEFPAMPLSRPVNLAVVRPFVRPQAEQLLATA